MALTALYSAIRHTTAFTAPLARHHATSSPSPRLTISTSFGSTTTTTTRIRHFSRRPSPSFQSRLSSLLFSSSIEDEIDPGIVAGTDLRVLKYPHPSLRAPNAEIPIEELTGPGCEISKIAKEMFLVMYASRGCGLAAPQVGINKRLMVYNEYGDAKQWMHETVMINPKIVEFSDATDVENEGCLSFPEIRGDILRPKWIKIEAYNTKGKKFKKKFKGWEARIFQHEYDHLEGKVFIDRLTEDGRKEVQPKLNELIDSFGVGGAL
jgi:peptide deformylase